MTAQPVSVIKTRNVLKGVPKIGFYSGGPRCPEDVCFPSVMRAMAEYLGEDVGCYEVKSKSADCRFGCTYSFFLGVTGAAFRLTWAEGWQGDNVEIMYMSDQPMAPFERAFEALGWEFKYLGKEDPPIKDEAFRQEIVESIDRGMPVVAFGVIGPPEACLITGYDDGGDLLTGWNFFQDFPEFKAGQEFEPCGYFRIRNWYATTEALIIPGEKVKRLEYKEIFRKSLEWAVKVMRTPRVTAYGLPRANGVAAFDAWIEAILRDEEFNTDNFEALNLRFGVHDDAVGTVAEARWYGSVYLSRLANMAPGNVIRPEILKAAACFAKEHDLMWDAWGAVGGIGREPDRAWNFKKPDVRRKLAEIIRETRELDDEAAGYIEKALTGTSPG
jgi:hypothetical protein